MLASVGSLGDVHPFLAIGQALRARGHAVTLICNDALGPAAAAAGLQHAPLGPGVSLEAAMASPNLWHPIKGLGVFWKHMLAPAIGPTFRHIERLAAAGPCVVVAPPPMFGARFAREAFGVPLLSAYTAPTVLRSQRAPLTMAHWRLPRGTPQTLVRLAWQALDRYKLHPMAERTLQQHAAALGCAPPPSGRSLFGDWMHSPDGGLTLFPEWFAPARPGWPPGLQFGGFPLYRGDAGQPLPAAVEQFLQAGPAPVVFMPGTAMRHAQGFFRAAVDATERLGLRALLLTPDAAQLPAPLPGHTLHADYLPFAQLLPRAAALVHHGGIGSCAQALQAGRPQLIMPMAHDQFDNAQRVAALGLGLELRPQHFDAPRLARALQRLLAIPAPVLQQCRERLASSALPGICAAIEGFAARHHPAPARP